MPAEVDISLRYISQPLTFFVFQVQENDSFNIFVPLQTDVNNADQITRCVFASGGIASL
jgi:hypothetical protein